MSPEDPGIPEGGEHIWECFSELSSVRKSDLNGPLPIAHADMLALVEVTGVVMLAGEWKIVRAIDNAFLEAVGAEQRERIEREKAQVEKK